MARLMVSDELWGLNEPLIPKVPRRPRCPGRRRLDDRKGRADRLVASGDRHFARAGGWGGAKTGPSPIDRSRSGSKHQLIACGRGTPLVCSLTAATAKTSPS